MNKQVRIWLALSFVVAGVLSLFASSHPDGFEKAGEDTGYIHTATSYLSSPFPDYSLPNVDSWLSDSLAGVIGVFLTYVLFVLFGKWAGRNTR
ncbi:PDGLE domain-containing protein [Ammoniphilus sp. YIM 78166]|uniref:PDGLE domain-containing protein n=1 Tax=Ammoniphilus sp. YIM 78166 TaxID=1644106 RepID=UPI00106FDFD6|nr:PDGLE domain-containing protein [Ammoniphilus sp. YIM 78166]